MTAAAWVCDSCHTNNLAQATVCRVCHSQPGSATGQAQQVPIHQEPVRQQTAQPTFVESRYGMPTQQQSAPPPELPRITLIGGAAAEPAPPAREAPRPSRTAMWLVVIGILLLVLLVAAVSTDLSKVFGSGPTSTPTPVSNSDSNSYYSGSTPSSSSVSSSSTSETPSAPSSGSTPCPSEVAVWLPDGGSGSELVAGYLADHHVVTICRDSAGDLHYDGQVRGKAPSDQTHISIYASETASGYTADNNGYVYDITDDVLTVVDDKGTEVLRSTLTRTGP